MENGSPRVVITNTVLENTGDAAILLGILSALEAEFGHLTSVRIHDANAPVTHDLFPELDIRQQCTLAPRSGGRVWRRIRSSARRMMCRALLHSRLLRRGVEQLTRRASGRSGLVGAVRDIVEADVIVSSGGTYLTQSYDFRHRVLELQVAKAFEKPLVMWTQSVGPIQTPAARRSARALSGLADAVFLRDRASLMEWNTVIGGASETRIAPDAAFCLTAPHRPARSGSGTKPRIVLSVRHWTKGVESGAKGVFGGYSSAIRGMVTSLVAKDAEVVALSTCQGLPAYPVDDSRVARDLLGDLAVRVDGIHRSPHEFIDELRYFDVAVCTRMHMAILALIARVPVVGIAYEFKTLELFKELGLSDFVFAIEEVSGAELCRAVESAIRTQPPLDDARLAALSDLAREPARAVRELVVDRIEMP